MMDWWDRNCLWIYGGAIAVVFIAAGIRLATMPESNPGPPPTPLRDLSEEQRKFVRECASRQDWSPDIAIGHCIEIVEATR